MTQIANITVKNGLNTDQVFTAYQPQAGSDPAVWYAKIGETRDKWTRLTALTTRSSRTATKQRINITIPYYDALGVKIGSIPASFEITVPDNTPASVIADAQAYSSNILNSTVVKDMILTGSAAI